MFGWNKTKKHNQYSPTNQKVQREFNFPFRNLAIKCDLFCYSGWYGAEKPSLLSGLEPICGKAVAMATRQDVSQCSSSSRTPQNMLPPVLGEQRSRVHKTRRTGMWRQQAARTLCFFMGYTSRAKEGKEKEPCWEEELGEPLNWDGE